ncbi:MAG: hypothetical protein WAV70_21880 [Anaerolineae bacterium]
MNVWPSESVTTWDAVRIAPQLPMVREERVAYHVRARSPLCHARLLPILRQGTTSSDVRFSLGETGDPFGDASVAVTLLSLEEFYRFPRIMRSLQVRGRGPFGGPLISLAEARELDVKIALEAESRRQEARERDALYWSDLEDET